MRSPSGTLLTLCGGERTMSCLFVKGAILTMDILVQSIGYIKGKFFKAFTLLLRESKKNEEVKLP